MFIVQPKKQTKDYGEKKIKGKPRYQEGLVSLYQKTTAMGGTSEMGLFPGPRCLCSGGEKQSRHRMLVISADQHTGFPVLVPGLS